MSWQVGGAANVAVAVAYMAIALAILGPLIASKQVRSNPLALSAAVIFMTAAGHRAYIAFQLFLPLAGKDVATSLALRIAWGWDMVFWDVVPAAAGIAYWVERRKHRLSSGRAQLFEDKREKQRRALEINDNIVQGLTVAQMALEVDQPERCEEAIQTALVSARTIITELLGDAPDEMRPGDLRRSKPAEVR